MQPVVTLRDPPTPLRFAQDDTWATVDKSATDENPDRSR